MIWHWMQCIHLKMIYSSFIIFGIEYSANCKTHILNVIYSSSIQNGIEYNAGCTKQSNFWMLSLFFYLAGEWWRRCGDRLDLWDWPTPDDADGHQTSRHQRTCQKTWTSRPLDREDIRGVLWTGMSILSKINILINVNLIYM